MTLDGKKVAILAEADFEDSELTEPLEAMKRAGAQVTIVGSGSTKSYHGKKGKAHVDVDVIADSVQPTDFDAVIVPGGLAPDRMRLHTSMIDFARKAHEAGKLIAAICHGPQLLVSADILHGRRVTSAPSIAVDLRNAGATWVDQPVVQDDNFITSRKPDDLEQFDEAIIQYLRD